MQRDDEVLAVSTSVTKTCTRRAEQAQRTFSPVERLDRNICYSPIVLVERSVYGAVRLDFNIKLLGHI